MLIGFAALAGSAHVSLTTGEGEWFQRSGSLLVLFSAIVEIQQTAKKQPKEAGVTINGSPITVRDPVPTMSKLLHALAWGGIVTGTAVWGYGDLMF
ncbi:MAG: hypothetical protein OXL68_19260 [Paracoccaceae bacterium]|nr:hypothetical protein [Paracoccaceae bacterium]